MDGDRDAVVAFGRFKAFFFKKNTTRVSNHPSIHFSRLEKERTLRRRRLDFKDKVIEKSKSNRHSSS